MARYTPYPGAMCAEITGAMGIIGRAVRTRADIIRRVARAECGHETGHLAASINTDIDYCRPDGVKATIGTSVPYAEYNHEGTGLWGPTGTYIVPRRAKYMVFEIDGRTIYAKRVRGYPGTEFLIKGMHAQDWPVIIERT
ncbi:hypothetical protein [Streptomyces noursei]